MSKRHTNGNHVMYSTCIAGDNITMVVDGKKMYSPQEFNEVLTALDDLLDANLKGTMWAVAEATSKANDVIAKFERVVS